MEYSPSADQTLFRAPAAPVDISLKEVILAFAFITLAGIGLLYAMQGLLVNDELYFTSLAEKFTAERIQESVDQAHRWAWLLYTIVPVSNLIRFVVVASCLSIGYFFSTNKWSFRPFIWVAIQAELVLLLPILLKIAWFLFVQPHYQLDDLQNFSPLSLASLVDYNTTDAWLHYPLQIASVFEVAYWFALAYGIKKAFNLSITRALKLVACSYGTAMVLWVVFTMFLVINLS